jgi:hypothetical protein
MSCLIESLKALYQKGGISAERIKRMSDEGKITLDEYSYITSKEGGGEK